MSENGFEPRIIAFLCNWCTYAGADLAGTSRLQYPPNVRIIRLMCSGAVDPIYVLKAGLQGADGVLIGGCRLNECNYTTHGNYHALNMVLLCQKLMEHMGLNPERLKIAFMSSAEGNTFAEVLNDFGSVVRELGPLGGTEGLAQDVLKSRLAAVRKLVPYIKLVTHEKLSSRPGSAEDYDSLFTTDEVDRLFP